MYPVGADLWIRFLSRTLACCRCNLVWYGAVEYEVLLLVFGLPHISEALPLLLTLLPPRPILLDEESKRLSVLKTTIFVYVNFNRHILTYHHRVAYIAVEFVESYSKIFLLVRHHYCSCQLPVLHHHRHKMAVHWSCHRQNYERKCDWKEKD